jgi:hypothetical protein
MAKFEKWEICAQHLYKLQWSSLRLLQSIHQFVHHDTKGAKSLLWEVQECLCCILLVKIRTHSYVFSPPFFFFEG